MNKFERKFYTPAQNETPSENVEHVESKESLTEEAFFPQLGVIVPAALTREKVQTDMLPKVQEVLQASGMSEEEAKTRIAKSLGAVLEAKDKNIHIVRDDVLRILHNMNYELTTEIHGENRKPHRERKSKKTFSATEDQNKREKLLEEQSNDFQKILDARKRRAKLKKENKN
jgi:hypothetical protein